MRQESVKNTGEDVSMGIGRVSQPIETHGAKRQTTTLT